MPFREMSNQIDPGTLTASKNRSKLGHGSEVLLMPSDVASELERKLARERESFTAKRKERDKLDEAIRTSEALIQAYETVIQSEGGTVSDSLRSDIDVGSLAPQTSPSVPPSIPMAVTAVLVEEDRAMHADEILRELRRRGRAVNVADPKASVVTALVRGMKRGKFERVGPNTYRITARE